MRLFGKKKVKKQVLFNLDLNTAVEENYGRDETLNLDEEWWGEDDGESFKQRDKNLAMFMAEKRLTPDQLELEYGESSRGMELQFQENANVIVTRQTNSRNAVRSLQQLYAKRDKKKPDEEAKSIARAYSLCSEGAIKDALRLAEEDAKYVQDFVVNDVDVARLNKILPNRSASAPVMRSSIKKAEIAKQKKKAFRSLRSTRF